MPGMQINMNEVGVLVPEGTYRVAVADVVAKTPYSGEGKYLNWKLSILDEEYGDQLLWFITSLKPSALVMLKRAFAAVGVDGDVAIEWVRDTDTQRSTGSPLVTPDLTGREAIALVEHAEWQGEMRTKVRRLLPVPKV